MVQCRKLPRYTTEHWWVVPSIRTPTNLVHPNSEYAERLPSCGVSTYNTALHNLHQIKKRMDTGFGLQRAAVTEIKLISSSYATGIFGNQSNALRPIQTNIQTTHFEIANARSVLRTFDRYLKFSKFAVRCQSQQYQSCLATTTLAQS